jgi:GTPase-associated adaptor domain-containing protein/calcineurin-like phosphoesterase family protein
MLILNISDIHFRYPICDSILDPDRPFRTRLIQDARSRAAELGAVDAIIVGGDIAYGGSPKEYEAAYTWIYQLADECGCKLEHVFVIPGNHDVDRKIASDNPSVRNVHGAITNAEPHRRERELYDQFRDLETCRALFAPIGEYNVFAAKFNCQLYSPERLFWFQEVPLDHQTHIRFYGLTSTLLSGVGGRNDVRPNLYLSPLQTALDPIDGIVNVVVCHHPPDWLMDHDDVEDAVCGRAPVQFFGHRHRQRIHREKKYVRFSSAAVNPDRHEIGWEPGYNIVRLAVGEKDGRRILDIEAHLRVWQTNPEMFRAKQDSDADNADIFRHELPLNGVLKKKPSSLATIFAPLSSGPASAAGSGMVADVEVTMSDDRTRNLVLRFWDLASSERREIALDLGIVSEDEIRSFPEAERYGRALRRAGERGLLDKLADEIEKKEKH